MNLAKKQVRDNNYYIDRLKRDHPSIYADLLAGKYRTVTEAAVAAGLKRPRTRLQELKNGWDKASLAEQRAFIAWLNARRKSLSARSTTILTASAGNPLAIDCYLQPWAIARITDILSKRHIRTGEVMRELGYKALNPSLGFALVRKWRLRLSVIEALEKWLVDNADI